MRRLLVCQAFRLEYVKSMDSTVSIRRPWRFSSKLLIKMLAVTLDTSLDVVFIQLLAFFVYPFDFVHSAWNVVLLNGELIAWLHWLACCWMHCKRCPSEVCVVQWWYRVRLREQFKLVPVSLPEVQSSHWFTWGGATSGTGVDDVGTLGNSPVCLHGRVWEMVDWSSVPC